MDEIMEDNANMGKKMEGRHDTSALGVAWPALLSQAQATRVLAEACRDMARNALPVGTPPNPMSFIAGTTTPWMS